MSPPPFTVLLQSFQMNEVSLQEGLTARSFPSSCSSQLLAVARGLEDTLVGHRCFLAPLSSFILEGSCPGKRRPCP